MGSSGQNHRAQSCVWGVVDRSGDFEAFVAGHGRRLIHLAELLLGDRGAAEDLTQDVLARAYLRWDRVERDDPYAYVRRALINARIDRWRRRLPIPVADSARIESSPTTHRGSMDQAPTMPGYEGFEVSVALHNPSDARLCPMVLSRRPHSRCLSLRTGTSRGGLVRS